MAGKIKIPYQPIKGKSLLFPSATYSDPNGRHLFVICTNPCAEKKVLLATVSTWRGKSCDPTCILPVNCHSFVTTDSFVRYQLSRIEDAATITAGVSQGVFIKQPDFDPNILQLICDGFETSQQAPQSIVAYYKANKN